MTYTLNEDITSGEIVYTRTGGTEDGLTPHKHTLGASEKTAGSHTADTGVILIDGAIYAVGFESIMDKAGNATVSMSNTSITYDSTAVAITNTSPASNGIITTSTVGYTLSEAASSGKVIFTWTGGSADAGSPRVFTLSGSDYSGRKRFNDAGHTLRGGAVMRNLLFITAEAQRRRENILPHINPFQQGEKGSGLWNLILVLGLALMVSACDKLPETLTAPTTTTAFSGSAPSSSSVYMTKNSSLSSGDTLAIDVKANS